LRWQGLLVTLITHGLLGGVRTTVTALSSADHHVELLLELLLIGTAGGVLDVLVQMAFTVTAIVHLTEALFTDECISTALAAPGGGLIATLATFDLFSQLFELQSVDR